MLTVIFTPQAKVKPHILYKRFQSNNKDSSNANAEIYELYMSKYNVKLLSLKNILLKINLLISCWIDFDIYLEWLI